MHQLEVNENAVYQYSRLSLEQLMSTNEFGRRDLAEGFFF